jgi:Na+/melibiose symporter-like transporter
MYQKSNEDEFVISTAAANETLLTPTALDSSSGLKSPVLEIVQEIPPNKLSNLEFALVFIGLSLAVFLASLDLTIVAVALNAISSEFNSLNQISWVATAYFLTATAFIPTYGQLADIFGRKPVFLAALIIFIIGSFLCGIAPNMNVQYSII